MEPGAPDGKERPCAAHVAPDRRLRREPSSPSSRPSIYLQCLPLRFAPTLSRPAAHLLTSRRLASSSSSPLPLHLLSPMVLALPRRRPWVAVSPCAAPPPGPPPCLLSSAARLRSSVQRSPPPSAPADRAAPCAAASGPPPPRHPAAVPGTARHCSCRAGPAHRAEEAAQARPRVSCRAGTTHEQCGPSRARARPTMSCFVPAR